MIFDQTIEQIEQLQSEKLRVMLDLCARGHPYYRALWMSRGIDVRTIRSVADLDELPITTKRELMAEPESFRLSIPELSLHERVLWEVIDGPEEWIGTRIAWDLTQDGDYTGILFKHQGWKTPGEFMHHCSTKWGVFLLSLKSLLESGKGAPFPNDVKIDSWEEAVAA